MIGAAKGGRISKRNALAYERVEGIQNVGVLNVADFEAGESYLPARKLR